MGDVQLLFSSLVSERKKNVVSNIRNNPLEFLSSNKYTEEALLRCICRALASGDEEYVLQLLILLQESCVLLVANNECLEEVIIALNDYFAHSKSANNFMKGQVLVTVTVILLNYKNQSENCESFRSLLTSHCELLWQLADNSNCLDNCILREVTSECLLEIEESFPCIFLSRMKDAERLSSKETLYPFQGYSCLLSLILKNACKVTPAVLARTNIMLALMKKPVHTNEATLQIAAEMVHKSEVALLLDLVPLMSTVSASYMVSNILDIRQSDIFYFKTFVHRFMLSSDLVMFQLALKVQRVFNQSIITPEEDDNMTRVLIRKSNNFGLPVPCRLLLFNWILEKLQTQPKSIAFNLKEVERNFVPQSLDVLEICEKKMKILVQLDHEFCNQLFFEQIGKMYLQISLDQDGRHTSAFFRILFRYLNFKSVSAHDDTSALVIVQRIGRLFSKDYPLFAMHHLDFVRRIKGISVLSLFAEDVLSTSVLHVTDLPIERIGEHLEHFLTFLAEVAFEEPRQSQPKAIVKFLSKVLGQKSLLNQSSTVSWLLGHLLLDVCKNLLCHHNENHLFKDFGDVLVQVMNEFCDVDVRDRAQSYYMLLTSLAPKKVSAMFEPKIRGPRESFVTGIGKSSYGFAAPVNHLPIPVLRLIRVKTEQFASYKELDESAVCEDVDVPKYFKYLQEFNICWKCSLKLKLETVADSNYDLQEFFGIVLTLRGPASCGEIDCVKVLHLTKTKGVDIAVDLQPLRPLPGTLSVSVMFNDSDGRVCYNELSPVQLEFEYLLQPLPVFPEVVAASSVASFRRRLARLLWEEFTADVANERYYQSVLGLTIDKTDYRNLLSDNYLASYITEIQDIGENISAILAMIVPQRSHLVLRIIYRAKENVVVRMVTDDIDVLRQINIYLLQFETKCRSIEKG